MKKAVTFVLMVFLSIFLMSGCGKKSSSKEVIDSEHPGGSVKPSAPVSIATFSSYFYKSDEQGWAPVLTNQDYASWIQLSPTESTRVYVELYLEEAGTFTLSYHEMQVGISDSTVLNEQNIKGNWVINGDKLTLSDLATLTKKVVNRQTQLTLGFLKDVQTTGLKNKQTDLTVETRVYTAIE